MIILPYDRYKAVQYARTWALSRNPQYYDFSKIGGDCTSFVSQCIFAGSKTMNYTPVTGWYYNSIQSRSASWSGVQYLYQFLTTNKGVGPFGTEARLSDLQPGDVVQLGRENGQFYHSLLITQIKPTVLVCAHSDDAQDRRLESYEFYQLRALQIQGVRKMK